MLAKQGAVTKSQEDKGFEGKGSQDGRFLYGSKKGNGYCPGCRLYRKT